MNTTTFPRILQVGDVVVSEASPFFVGIVDGREHDQETGTAMVSVAYGDNFDGLYPMDSVALVTPEILAEIRTHLRTCEGTCGKC